MRSGEMSGTAKELLTRRAPGFISAIAFCMSAGMGSGDRKA
jgi:hypothetical protein